MEGRNIVIERRSAEGQTERLPGVMQELVASSVDIDVAASSLKLDVLWPVVDVPEEYGAAFATIRRERANALFIPSTPLNFYHLRRIAEFARTQRLPSIHADLEYVKVGGLLAYGDDEASAYRHAATYVKRIIEGAKPGDLPFEQPSKAELVVNLNTAKALGLRMPQSLLLRANQVVE
jgi:putative ABC transport system substrate-binding protein